MELKNENHYKYPMLLKYSYKEVINQTIGEIDLSNKHDVGETAAFKPVEKGLILMRWIRKANENETLIKISYNIFSISKKVVYLQQKNETEFFKILVKRIYIS